jgi:hypothetical protein
MKRAQRISTGGLEVDMVAEPTVADNDLHQID